MADPSFFVGILGNIISILVFTSPITTFRRIVKKRSTEDFKWLPYATTLLSTSLWTFYGLLKPGGLLVVTVNGAGAALQATYVTLFLVYAPRETKAKVVKVVLAMNIGFLAAVVVVTLLALHGGARLLAVGVLCAALTIGMYAAPLSAMRMVVKTRSVEFMPFYLSFFLFLNGGVWSAYAVLVKDFFIMIPNAVGFVLGTAQLVLYTAYRKKKKPSAAAAGKNDDGVAELEEEEGVARLMGQVEMGQQHRRGRPLHKGHSLPEPPSSVAGAGPLWSPRGDGGFGSVVKSLSATPVELHSVLRQNSRGRFEAVNKDENDVEANR